MAKEITILSRPYNNNIGNNFRVNPVYNGLPFTVNSLKAQRNNFVYTCEIFDGNTKIARLKHNPDLTNYYGLFDVGPIFENLLSYDKNKLFDWGINGFTIPDETIKKYYVNFGCEYSRRFKYTLVDSDSGKARFNTTVPHNLKIGDSVYLEVSNGIHSEYNNVYSKIINTSNLSFTTEIPYVGTGDAGFFTEGETFIGNFTYTDIDGQTKLAFFKDAFSGTTNLQVGDDIYVKQDSNALGFNPAYDGNWVIKSIETTYVNGIPDALIIKTNIPATTSTVNMQTFVISLNNYKFDNQVNTSLENSWAYNGCVQYKEYPTFNINQYFLDGLTKKFLTNMPRYIEIGTNNYQTLSLFATNGILTPFAYIDLVWYPKIERYYGQTNFNGTNNTISLSGNRTNDFFIDDICYVNYGTFESNPTILSVTYIPFINRTIIITSDTTPITLNTGQIYLQARRAPFIYPEINANYNNARRVDIQIGIPLQQTQLYNFPTQKLDYFTIQATDIFFNPKSEMFTFKVIDTCQNWNTYKLVWLNPFGGWDWFEFKGKETKNKKIEKSNFEKRTESLKGNTWRYDVGDRGTTTYNVKTRESIITTSGYINLETANWLMEIYDSPEVYIVEGTELIPINLVNDNVQYPKQIGGMRNLEIEFQMAQNKIIQRG